MVYKRTGFTQIINLITPATCFLCQRSITAESTLCRACSNDLHRPGNSCCRCGRPLTSGSICSYCYQQPPAVDRLICAFDYRYPVDRLIKIFKYNQQLTITKLLGRQLVDEVIKVSTCYPERIIPVPMHPYRYLARGFNQSIEISAYIAHELGIKADFNLVERARNTRPQYSLDPGQRKRNVKRAFRLKYPPGIKSVAIIDDVVTTGATINEIARTLKRAGISRVEAWVCASANQAF